MVVMTAIDLGVLEVHDGIAIVLFDHVGVDLDFFHLEPLFVYVGKMVLLYRIHGELQGLSDYLTLEVDYLEALTFLRGCDRIRG